MTDIADAGSAAELAEWNATLSHENEELRARIIELEKAQVVVNQAVVRERQRCAEVCLKFRLGYPKGYAWGDGYTGGREDAARAILALR